MHVPFLFNRFGSEIEPYAPPPPNVSGISGLATKTSYMMFLIQSILQGVGGENMGVIIFNVKQEDLYLLCLYRELEMDPEPFNTPQSLTTYTFSCMGLLNHVLPKHNTA